MALPQIQLSILGYGPNSLRDSQAGTSDMRAHEISILLPRVIRKNYLDYWTPKQKNQWEIYYHWTVKSHWQRVLHPSFGKKLKLYAKLLILRTA